MSELFRTTSQEMQHHLIKLAVEAGASEHSLAEVALCLLKVSQQQLLREFAPIRCSCFAIFVILFCESRCLAYAFFLLFLFSLLHDTSKWSRTGFSLLLPLSFPSKAARLTIA